MARNIKIDHLANEITKAVQEYTEDVTKGIEKEVKETADLVLKEVKSTAPKRTGEYAKSFTKTDKSIGGIMGKKQYYVWNKKHYRRVHLLEFGHAKVNGGRVQAYPHLRPAHDKHAEKMAGRIERIIRNGG